jgi:hypothetical protein
VETEHSVLIAAFAKLLERYCSRHDVLRYFHVKKMAISAVLLMTCVCTEVVDYCFDHL